MTPEEIEEHFGRDSLNLLYDCLLQNTVHGLADWILALHTEQEIGEWVMTLKADLED